MTSLAALAFEVPRLQGPVMDMAGYISQDDRRELTQILYDYNRAGRAQIQVLVVPDLQGEPIESASIQITDKWKLGDQKKDNGILFLISAGDRKLRIEVGQGLEGILPDVTAKRIVSDVVIPYFKARRTSEGIRAGVYAIIENVDKEYADAHQMSAPVREQADDEEGKHPMVPLIIFFVLFIVIFIGRGGGGGRRRGLYGGWGGGFGGGGFGGGSSGGGWSGGGGGFSGGGASGSW